MSELESQKMDTEMEFFPEEAEQAGNEVTGENTARIEQQQSTIEIEQTVSSEQLTNAIKLSRQFMILMEDYRYLLSCYQETCSCHLNFDHQIFFRKLEDKHDILSNVASTNALLSDALEDSDDIESLSNLIDENLKANCEQNKASNTYIHRIKIRDQPSTKSPLPQTSQVELSTKTESTSSNAEISNTEQIDLTVEKLAFRCSHPKCEFITFKQTDILKHFNNHSKVDFSSQKFEKTDVLYVCEQCGKEFSGQKWLDNHVDNVHAFAKTFSCDFPNCFYKSKFRCVIDDHRKRHEKIKEFKCSWENCTSEFATKRDMIAHVNFYHRGIKNYICNWKNCNASFKDSNRLRHHYFTHTGERPYHCPYPGCGASFKQMPHLHKHRKTHNWEVASASNQESEEVVKSKSLKGLSVCPIDDCNADFTTESDLNKHIVDSHEDVEQLFKCELEDCSTYFQTNEQCQQHMKEDHSMLVSIE